MPAMPAVRRLDPTLLDVVARAATRSGAAALEASHELLAHYSDVGHGPSQLSVDTLIDRAAEALRALTDSLVGISSALTTPATVVTTTPATATATAVAATVVTATTATAVTATAATTTAVTATGPSGSGRDPRA